LEIKSLRSFFFYANESSTSLLHNLSETLR
jgi:hypothetical protein